MTTAIKLKRNRYARRKVRTAGATRQGSARTGRPRLCVVRTARHMYAQVIDDAQGVTLVAASTLSPELREGVAKTWNQEAAKAVGKLIAEKAKAKGISEVAFDRHGCRYHGRIKALAEAAREGGLVF